MRVREARPRLLGVHAAIQADLDQLSRDNPNQSGPAVENGVEDELPVYVPRDLDVDLRTKLTVAQGRGGFVLLTGDSSVGKTRALFQALRDVVPEWWLLHPADAPAVQEFAAASTARTVVWLDELQNYLDHPGGLPAAAITRLISAGNMVVATLWPGEYATRVARRTPGQPDRYANDRQLLGLADIVEVPAEFSTAERRRAEYLADTDRRIRIALDTPDAGVTQVMAAGPQLIRHWEHAPAEQRYGKAVITAALDARRVGARAPITRAYLDAAAPTYLEKPAQATAPRDWLDQALDYATQPLHGAATALIPIPAGMGRIAGYQVADYLHQHAQRVRRTIHLSDAVWQALVDHHHPDDTAHLAENAERRGRDHDARILYQQAADTGDPKAADSLDPSVADAEVIDEDQPSHRELIRDEPDEKLAARADARDHIAADVLASRLAEEGQVEELTARADAGDWFAALRLPDLLAKQGRMAELTARADTGDWFAVVQAAYELFKRGCLEGTIAVLRPCALAGDLICGPRMAELMADLGWIDELDDEVAAGTVGAAAALRRAREQWSR